MRPCFVLALPRSRTAWLTAYLNGLGVMSLHDAWKYARSASELRDIMELYTEDAPVVNVDSTNIMFLDEIRDEFPDAKFVKIIRDVQDVEQSMKASYGDNDYSSILRYAEVLEKAEAGLTIDYNKWALLDSLKIFKYITDSAGPASLWHMQAHDFKIEITDNRIHNDIWYGQSGRLDHIVKKLRN